MQEKQELYFSTNKEWLDWLITNHSSSKGVYLILYKKSSEKASMTWEEAVRVALCFGWIDSTSKRIDDEKRKQLFTPRNSKSAWSKLNKNHIEDLIKQNLMHSSGLERIEAAKKDGTWSAMDDVENLIIPPDLLAAFKKNNSAFLNYEAFSKTYKKGYLSWLNSAKRPETREKRIKEIIKLCSENIKSRN